MHKPCFYMELAQNMRFWGRHFKQYEKNQSRK